MNMAKLKKRTKRNPNQFVAIYFKVRSHSVLSVGRHKILMKVIPLDTTEAPEVPSLCR